MLFAENFLCSTQSIKDTDAHLVTMGLMYM